MEAGIQAFTAICPSEFRVHSQCRRFDVCLAVEGHSQHCHLAVS